MFNIKNIVSKITERGKESQPNSPARMGQDDDKLSTQGAEGFLCPKCMMALPTPEELQSHYELSHDTDKDQNSPDASTSSSAAGFLELHQEVGERYSRNRPDGNFISQEKLIAEVHGITDISELQKSLMDALESKGQLQLEKEHLELKTAELAQANASLKAFNDEEQWKQTALKERLKIVEAQLAHRESIDDAAVLRQELVQVQRVMDKMTREREGERDDLQSERDELVAKVSELRSELMALTESKKNDHLVHQELVLTQALLDQEKWVNSTTNKNNEVLMRDVELMKEEFQELRSEFMKVKLQRDELNKALIEAQHKEIDEKVNKVVASSSELEATPARTIGVLGQSDYANDSNSADTLGILDKEKVLEGAKHSVTAEEKEKTDLQKKVEELTLKLDAECLQSEGSKSKIAVLEKIANTLSDKLAKTQNRLKENDTSYKKAASEARSSHEALIAKLSAEAQEKDLRIKHINEENTQIKLETEELNQSLVDSQSNLTDCNRELSETKTKLVNVELSNFELHKSIAEAYLVIERMKDDTSVRISEVTAANHDVESRMCILQQEMSRLMYEHKDELDDMAIAHKNSLQEYEKEKMSICQLRREHAKTNDDFKKKLEQLEEKLQVKEKAVDQCKQEMESMELENKAALSKLKAVAASDNETQKKTINKLQAAFDDITGEKLALEALLETSQTEQKSLLEKFYQSCNDNESQRRTVDDLRRRLEDSQSALHELARENQILQLELEKLLGRKWTEDADAAQCKLCSKEFSLIVRKHHCRNCGQIFCSDCSNKMAPLANNKKPVRVCDSCYNELASK